LLSVKNEMRDEWGKVSSLVSHLISYRWRAQRGKMESNPLRHYYNKEKY
jgi:hypothetical protein